MANPTGRTVFAVSWLVALRESSDGRFCRGEEMMPRFGFRRICHEEFPGFRLYFGRYSLIVTRSVRSLDEDVEPAPVN